jgi:hypothetical protein
VIRLGQDFVYRLLVMSGWHLSNLGPRSFAWYPAWMIADSRSMDRSRNWGHRDPLTAFERWAEQGQAPTTKVAANR